MNTQIKQQDSELVRAYERVKGELAALKPEQVRQVNLDVPEAVATIVCVVPGLKILRERLKRELAAFDLEAFDKLEDYAWALSHAHTLLLMATRAPDDVPVLVADATRLRKWLLADVHSLIQHQLVDKTHLAKLKGPNGYKNIAHDLQVLSAALQANWPKIQGRSPTTTEDLETALRLSGRMLRLVGARDHEPAYLAEARERRQRAFTLTIRVYEETRRAVRYILRVPPEAKADSIIPSLYSGKLRRKQQADALPNNTH